MSTKALVPLNVLAIGTEPAGQRAGDLYFNTGTLKLRIYSGGTPIVEGGYPSSTFTGSYDGGVS
jgi:hypothetical protein